MLEHQNIKNELRRLPKDMFADTWWFGLSGRWSEEQFLQTAKLRKAQGFNAIQLVVGVPPEVGPLHGGAASEVGGAWDLAGNINYQYLKLAKQRVGLLAKNGLCPVVYGAWGHQIEWIGVNGMKKWWKAVAAEMDEFNPVYCLTGEIDLWVGMEGLVYPDKSTQDIIDRPALSFVASKGWARKLIRKPLHLWREIAWRTKAEERRNKWSEVLTYLHTITTQPIIVHVTPGKLSDQCVDNSDCLSATTVQTGHDESTRNLLWQLPLKASQGGKPFLNLEPWYEGIFGKFIQKDQLFAFWASRLAGADGFCYGAHGLWNLGDGRFLSHWGSQTWQEAVKLKTPVLLGKSRDLLNRYFREIQTDGEVVFEVEKERLKVIGRNDAGTGKSIMFYPEVDFGGEIPKGEYWLPEEGEFVKTHPRKGQLVVISKGL